MAKTEEKKTVGVAAGGQYIKDLSFENPCAPEIYTIKHLKPEIKVSVDINVKKLQEEKIFSNEEYLNEARENAKQVLTDILASSSVTDSFTVEFN